MKMMMRVCVMACALMGFSFAVLGEESQPNNSDNIVYSSNIHAMVKVLSSATNTIISVPWMFYTPDGASTTNLPVDRLVRPTNLTLGDYVLAHLPNPEDPAKKTFAAWQLTKTTERIPGVTDPSGDGDYCWKWEPVMTAARVEEVKRFEQDNNGPYRTDVWKPEDIATQTECRGYGVWLLRQSPIDGDGNPKPFYLYGQWTTEDATVTIKGGTSEVPVVCTMLANPVCLDPTDVNKLTWSNVGETDTLIITTDSKTTLYCTYKDGKWGYSKQTRVNKNEGKEGKAPYWVVKTERIPAPFVPAGTGFWYVRRKSGDVSLEWKAPSGK